MTHIVVAVVCAGPIKEHARFVVLLLEQYIMLVQSARETALSWFTVCSLHFEKAPDWLTGQSTLV